MLKSRRIAATVLAGAAAAAGLVPLTAAPAAADSRDGCQWPYVCFYLTKSDYTNNRPTAAYKDVTDRFQALGSRSRGADYIVNTRNDDRVRVQFLNGGSTHTMCLPPNVASARLPADVVVTAVKIEEQSICPPTP
ncbi:hypothetical protein [Streptomyces sp. PA5.6]|uniref:hypothetical protein n=1 Tax=Streptomyces sp. PA5.6 TaxID=3035651 RepID=UPI003904A63B